MRRFLVTLMVSIPILAQTQTYKGEIVGKVVDAKTLEPAPFANIVVVEKENVGAASDIDGNFRIQNLDVGTYSLKVSAIGYESKVITNVVLTTGRATPLMIKLNEATIELKEVTVQASYFDRAQQMSMISANVLDRAEILRSPGSIQDVQRVVQSLPGVASSTDNINELIVRGGAPYENLTVMDYMEIPSINHYSNQFNSAGPINMVNADMIEDAQFSSGGFPVQYGDKTSSVLNLTVREGNRTKGFASKTGFNIAGVGTLAEGGFADGRGSYIISARNSLLELIDRVMGLSSLSLTAVPKYWDAQAKITYDLHPSHKLMFNLLYGDSRISIEGDPKEADEERKNLIDSSSVTSLSPITKQYAAGVSLRSLWGKEGYSVLTLYSVGTTLDQDIRENFTRRVRGGEGEVLDYKILNSRIVFSNHASESFAAAKYELFYQIHPQHELSAGAQIQTSQKWENDVYLVSDTLRYDLDRNGTYETGPVVIPPYSFRQQLGFGDASKYFLFVEDKWKITPQLKLTFGLRYDHFTYSGKGSPSPRASMSYQIVPSTSTVTFALGQYVQTQPFPYYGDRRNIGYNRRLDNLKANHYVLGYEHILNRGLKLSVEMYYKTYKNSVVSEDFVHSAVDTFWSDRNLAIGERRSYGLEFFVEQKQVGDFYGTLSVSLSKTQMKDPRIPPLVDWFASEYDYPVIVTALAGKVVKGTRQWFNEMPFFIKYPAYLLPFSDEMEISFKYRYQRGRPYTPQQFVAWQQTREGGVKWSKGAWISTDDHNGTRYPDYSRLDVQWISRFYFSSWNINAYVAIQNVFNTKNVFFESYRSDGTKETVYQFSFLPVAGLEVEF
ncbi:MAG: TonB-dependent receptor [Ignavibacteriales bacterium]|nr:TonB-dependent receptor [Ignavibacteriales bacterium]